MLRLALLGFSSAQQAMLETALVVLRTRLRWRVVALDEADAVCVNGSRVVTLPDGSLQIDDSAPGGPPLRIDPSHSDRPIAFSLPLAASIAAASTFDMASPPSTRAMLEKFEGWLRPVSVQFCLASRIVQSRLDVVATVYHVSVDGRLVAVVSRRTGVGVLPIADPFHLENALWAKRPGPADDIPGHFVQVGLSQVLWEYAMRTRRNLLPTYFRAGPIYWCRSPQLPQRLFRDSHLLIVRELTGGLYFGKPSKVWSTARGRRAVDTLAYREQEIERLVRLGFEHARARRGKVTSVDKSNVLASSQLWRSVVNEVAGDFPDVTLEHALVDSSAMTLITRPRDFDVMVMENTFGDILSDEAAVLAGSLGMLPSASLSGRRLRHGGQFGLYEPIHGSAPDIAGQGVANPSGAILSAAMLLRVSLGRDAEASVVERAVEAALAGGARTRDIARGGPALSTADFGRRVRAELESMLA